MQAFLSSTATRRIAFLMVLVMGIFSIAPRAEAGLISSAQALKALNSQEDLAKVQKVLENKRVRARLEALGYSSEEISARLNQLSDDELHTLATRIDNLTAGGDAIGFVIGILVIVLLVIVILKLLDKQIIIT